jgi:diguanylate cyclase (GGDEF)-like protein
VPAGALFGAYQAYTRERQKTERIEFLYNSGRTLASTAGQEAGILQLLQDALGEFRADVAQLTVQTGAGSPFDLRTTVRAGEIMELDQPVEPSTGDAVLERVMSADKGMILAPPHTDPAVVAFLGKRGIEDAIITALKAENRVMGTILVGSRMGGLGTFSEDDLNLLATLANQLGAAVENARLERVLHHQAFHDSLTSLANRPLFNERIEHAVAQRDSRVGILLVDIDDFKVVNDTLGHAAGDQLLVSVARRLQAVVRASDTAARLGGDEFALLVEDLRDLEDATMAAGRVVETLRQPFSLNGQEIRVTASMGIATNLDAPADAGGLLMQADVAMYAAKRSDAGPGGYQVFQPSMQDEVTERHALREDLHRAIERGELVNHYQPLVSLETGEVVGAEALVRWQSKERGLVSPAYFIRVAEESGLILELGRWVLREACGQARDWQREFPARKALGVSVNLSAVQLRQPGFVDDVVRVLQQTGLEPGLLTLEITESTFMDDTRSAIARLRELRGLGIRLELDDFGTGYSSLSILRDLPLDGLKIDKSFVDGLHAAGDRPAFLQAIVRLAQALDLDMVGEGIEQEPQADALRGMGCQRGQGYFFARPLPAQDMIAFLHQAEPSSGAVLPLPSRRR